VPLFEYECDACHHQFEALVIGDRKPVCPKCKSDRLTKRVSALGFAGAGGLSSGRSSGCGSTGGGGG
jgi:putative FmdB family regulatory protein